MFGRCPDVFQLRLEVVIGFHPFIHHLGGVRLAHVNAVGESLRRRRRLWFQKHSILKWRYRSITAIGSIFLVSHAWNKPIAIHGFAILAFLAIVVGTGVSFVFLLSLSKKFGLRGLDEQEARLVLNRIDSSMKAEPWRLLLIPSEDGFFLLPLLYIGITPLSASIAAALFAAVYTPGGIAFRKGSPIFLWPCLSCHLASASRFLLRLLQTN